MAKNSPGKTVEALKYEEATRKNIPTAEYESVMQRNEQDPVRAAYERTSGSLTDEKNKRLCDLDPQLVWRGKDEQDWSDLVVHAPPLYIQEKIHPKALINDLLRATKEREHDMGQTTSDLFADFNGIPKDADKTEFYQHDQNWSNRMILGDSLQVMASLAEREGLRGKVQCIYLDPPYGTKFNSNFQWSTEITKVKDGDQKHISREPEQVKAFRDTWRDGIHSYLTYLRDRLTAARDLLAQSGSIFLQIGDENVHLIRNLLDQIFGANNFVSIITYKTSVGLGSDFIDNTCNYLLWYCKDNEVMKFRALFRVLEPGKEGASRYKKLRQLDLAERPAKDHELAQPDSLPDGARLFRDQGLTSRSASATTLFPVEFRGKVYEPSTGGWRTSKVGMRRVVSSDRVLKTGENISYRKYFDDFKALSLDNFWADVSGGITSRSDPKIYVVQTSKKIIESERIAEHFLEIVRASSSEDDSQLKTLVSDEIYRATFLKLARNLAPTGKSFERIELRASGESPIGLDVESRANINKRLREKFEAVVDDSRTEEVLLGTLRAVHLDQDWLEIAVDGTFRRIEDLKDAIDDVIGPMVNRSVSVRVIRQSSMKLRFVDIELAD